MGNLATNIIEQAPAGMADDFPADHRDIAPFSVVLVKPFLQSPTRTCAPPLGVLYLASALRTHYGERCKVHLLDLSVRGLFADDVREELERIHPSVIGISALNCEAAEGRRLAELAKEINPDCLAILGGPYALHNSRMIFDSTPVYDWIIEGSGERTLLRSLDRHWRGKDLGEDIPGLSYRRPDGSCHITHTTDVIRELDDLAM
ncbi:MAG: hypothetical protein EP312_03925, partial [Gammaproteobacteria bacterium]